MHNPPFFNGGFFMLGEGVRIDGSGLQDAGFLWRT
jgi:hypothetical protein